LVPSEVLNSDPDLLKIVHTGRAVRRFPYLLDGRQKEPDQNRDDRNDDQQLYQRKPTVISKLRPLTSR
jgi:hypothetical protein